MENLAQRPRDEYRERTKVWIVDDNDYYCFVLSHVLNETGSVECTRTFTNPEQALLTLRTEASSPEVILLDINMPQLNGVEMIGDIKRLAPAVHIIMLTVNDYDEMIRNAIKNGAEGYLLKSLPVEDVIKGVESVMSGGAPYDPMIVQKILRIFSLQPDSHPDYGLTPREKEILQLLVKGYTMTTIADQLSITYATVNSHLKSIHSKLSVHSRSEVVVKALKEGLV